MKKKILCLVLILMLISAMFVLTGCGSDEENSSSSGNGDDTASSTVKIGDYVAYEVKEGESYTATAESTGYDEDQVFETTGDEKWRVLSIEDDGTINLILDGIVVTKYDKELYLEGIDGYTNGVEILNEVCAIYGTGEFAQSARSMKSDDITNMFDMEKLIDYYQDEYETDIESTTVSEQLNEIYKLIHVLNETQTTIDGTTYTYYDMFNWTPSSSKIGFDKVISNETYLDLLLLGQRTEYNDDVWLADEIVSQGGVVTGNVVELGIYYYSYYNYTQRKWSTLELSDLYRNYGSGEQNNSGSHSLRPVVTLKSSVTIDGGSGTEDDPYTLK